ncbi:hypothetical protein [Mumia zhuanghuii]|uniref:Uncharacterized protein n=1 Tax=Mumia zhuanghuii TaxID=2585211 RepID=A0A5C4ME24_9ACTN|nr:hypothetical protein [Mumia zhuanghuii]TNC31316.1 hypothetical protein FHE65_32115 [Mumia zhuanghuii]
MTEPRLGLRYRDVVAHKVELLGWDPKQPDYVSWPRRDGQHLRVRFEKRRMQPPAMRDGWGRLAAALRLARDRLRARATPLFAGRYA